MKKIWSGFFKHFLTLLLISIIFISGILLILELRHFSFPEEQEEKYSQRKYCVLVLGTSANEAFITQVYEGALSVSREYNTAVILHVPNSQAENISTQTLMDYAEYLKPDCIIAYMNPNEKNLKLPKKADGSQIPIITVGNYIPDIPSLSYIGINYSQVGKIVAEEITSSLKNSGSVYIIDMNMDNNPNYSMLMNVLMNSINSEKDITVNTLTLPMNSSFSREDAIRQQIASSDGLKLIVSLSEEFTVLTSQTLTDLNIVGKTQLIGFGDSADSHRYYEKGIISTLISINTRDIGVKAMREFFEFRETGYANNYVTSKVEVLKRSSK